MTSNYSGIFYTKSKTYEGSMRSLVRHIFKNEDKMGWQIEGKFVICKYDRTIDTWTDRMNRVFVGDGVYIRLWSIEDAGKRVRIRYTTYTTHYCCECRKEEIIEYGEDTLEYGNNPCGVCLLKK